MDDLSVAIAMVLGLRNYAKSNPKLTFSPWLSFGKNLVRVVDSAIATQVFLKKRHENNQSTIFIYQQFVFLARIPAARRNLAGHSVENSHRGS
jgi:hypothetical protein